MRLPLRARFAVFAAALVVLVASFVGIGAYLSFRGSLLSRADRTARTEANRLVGLVAADESGSGQSVDLADTSLTRQLATPGLIVAVMRPTGALVQATPGRDVAPVLSTVPRRTCLASGVVQQRSRPPVAVACARIGPARTPLGAIVVGVPLQSSLGSLAALRRALTVGVLAGGGLAALLSLLLARRALRPLKRIASTAETIRSGDLSERIAYRGRDEVGELAHVLDACFAELEGAVERQRRFAADASHELKTPLAAIRANVELLRGWAAADEEGRRAALESLDQSSRRASRLVADLLHLVRLEREPPRPRMPVRLDEVVLAAVREATPLRGDVAIRIVRLDDVTVPGDPLGLQQVLVNLLDNALAVSPSGSEVTVAMLGSADRACITVTDSGPGVEPDERERIFDRFYSKQPGGRSQAGAGLGLAIARSIAREHSGDLVVRVESGAGATFELILPLTASEPHRRAPVVEVQGYAAASRTTTHPPVSLG